MSNSVIADTWGLLLHVIRATKERVMKSMMTALSLMLVIGLVGCSDDDKTTTDEVCRPRGTCSLTSSSCAYDKDCPSTGAETCAWTQSFDRFVDNGNGTVTDWKTCLTWEKKTGIVGSSVDCASADVVGCGDPHGVNNRYTWSTGSPWNFDGTAPSVLLRQLNDAAFAGHSDWRLPTSAGEGDTGNDPELESILAATGTPRIDPIFGPTATRDYWSSSTIAAEQYGAWLVNFATGGFARSDKTSFNSVRAVRGSPGN
jgi:hypothetical protein